MICISIAQESRKFALVDMLNAAPQCDMIEVRLDRFEKDPELKELVSRKPHPLIMACRRRRDGGDWSGSEPERLTLLRQAVVSGTDYVEIELDVADQIRPYPGCKRVISYTNLQETPDNIGEIYDDARTHHPDVIKLTTLARTPEEAWPLLQIVSRATTPTVVVGLGKPGIMLSILGRRIGAPWTYAALERGMEVYPGQPTVHDLETIYHYRDIDKQTRFLGVTGFSAMQVAAVAALNAGLSHLQSNLRCLPLGVGDIGVFRKIMSAVKLAGVVVDDEHQASLAELAQPADPAVQGSGTADLLLPKADQWVAWNLLCRAAVTSLEQVLHQRYPSEKPLQGRMVVLVGTNSIARSLAFAITQRGGHVIIAGRDREAAQAIAQQYQCRFVQFEALYTTSHDVLAVCSDEAKVAASHGHAHLRGGEKGLHPGYLKPSITVMDLTSIVERSELLREAQARGCPVVNPRAIMADQAARQLQMLANQQVPASVLTQAITLALGEEV
jgi:3-dehydroquinate dehydratase/shikimate dehydrogenase